MPKVTDAPTIDPPPLTSGKAALARLEIDTQLAQLIAGVPTNHPDAELMQLCANHPRVSAAAAEHGDMETADVDPYWQAYFGSCDAIHDAVPSTVEGMVAKALAAKAEALDLDGDEHPANCPAEHWAWDLVNDLIRLNAAPNPDAELIALSQEFIDLEQRRDEIVATLENQALDAAVKQIQARQEVLAEQIDGISFKTMEGARMIARAAACWAKDVIRDGFAELGGLHGDLYLTLVKGLIGEAQP